MDFDPRDCGDERDPRDRDRDERDRDHDDDGLSLGRGPSSAPESHQERERDDDRHDARDRADHRDRDDARWPERDRDPRDRASDPREVFTRSLNLPRGRDREGWSMMRATANIRCGDPRAVRSQPSAHFVWCPSENCATVTTVPATFAMATSGICGNSG